MESGAKNSFFDLPDKELLNRIPLNAKVVLEVGCGKGMLGFEFKKLNPTVKYIGIESCIKDAQIARKKIDSVIIGNIEDYSKWLDKLTEVDCLILNNVLQHIKRPIELLKIQSDFLKKDAIIITLFSNPNHWSFLKNFFKGDIFSDYDLLNHNSLHSLTPESVSSLFHETSLKLFDITAISSITDNEQCNLFIDKMKSFLSELGVDREKFFSRISPFYFISRACYINSSRKLNIDILLGEMDIKGVSDSRIVLPYKSLSSQPRFNVNISNSIKINNNIYNYPKVFIISRPIHLRNEHDINKIKKLIDNNYLIIIDYDDDPNIISERYPQYIDWDFTFTSAHAIQTSNDYLANYLSSFNPEVKVFSNSISRIGDEKELTQYSYLRVFFGAINRKKDWFPWIDTLNNISKLNPNKLYFEVVHDLDFYNSLDIPQSQKRFTPTCDYQKYLQIMKGCDICFLPLNNNHFNNCKSDLKAVEAASFGLALLASNVVYSENFRHGFEASFFEDSISLSNILTEWIRDPSKVRVMGRKAQKYILDKRLFCYQLEERSQWYMDLWSRKDDLTQSIYVREPSISGSK